MNVASLNVGLPRDVEWHGQQVSTGIFKAPIAGRVALRRLNFDGDRQADLTVHGGFAKAAYCYPLEHYAYWERELKQEFAPGAFGENIDGQQPLWTRQRRRKSAKRVQKSTILTKNTRSCPSVRWLFARTNREDY